MAEIQTTYQTTAHSALEANVRLMAAAPTMRDLLDRIMTEQEKAHAAGYEMPDWMADAYALFARLED